MSKSRLAILAFTCAFVLTLGAYWEVMIYKHPPHNNLALWLPFIVLCGAHGVAAILTFLLQFPISAAIFVFACRRWHPLQILAVLVTVYALCAWAAMAMLKAGRW